MSNRNKEVSYDWCQYTNDVKAGLFTVTRVEKTDFCKTFSELEARRLAERLQKSENES